MKKLKKINKDLIWDYDIKESDLKNEDVLILYISRVLNNGTYYDVKNIPHSLILKYIDKLYLSKKVKNFWQWYLKSEKKE